MSLWQTITRTIPPVHPQGYPFIAIAAVITFLSAVFGLDDLAWILAGLTLWVVLFFRDPKRVTPERPGLVVSPADGRVSDIRDVVPPQEMALGDQLMTRVSIFMNVFDCHVNRLPLTGKIEAIHYHKGVFLNAELDKASEDNERNSLTISQGDIRIGVVQIAGLVARRIVCFTSVGQTLRVGERFGLIRFGSRLDVYLPQGTPLLVGLGQRAVAGETPLADLSRKTTDRRTYTTN